MREQGSLPTPLRETRTWEKSVYESEVGAKAGSALAEEIGMSFSGNERNKMFYSRGARDFRDISAIAGLDNPADGRVLSLWDYDRDGRQDLAVVNSNAPLLNLYRNEVPAPGKAIAINFVGGHKTATAGSKWSNRDGYGVKVLVQAGGQSYLRELHCGEGMASQNSKTLLIGIGQAEQADRVEVRWPSGVVSQTSAVEAGTLLTFFEDPADPGAVSGSPKKSPYLVKQAETRAPVTLTGPRYPAFPQLAGVEANKGLRLYTTMATWCAVCKEHLPQVRQLRDSFAEDRLGLYGLPVDPSDDPKRLATYQKDFKPAYLLLDKLPAPQKNSVTEFLKQVNAHEALPSTVVTDHSGQVLLVTPGLPTVSQLRALESRQPSP